MKKRMITILLGVLLIAGLVFALPSSVSGCGQETLRIGYTLYEPMNYLDESGELTGHDTEFAEMACEELGYTPEFIRIEWSKKIIELESGRIDLIWNGMTITDELKDAMLISDPYMVNQQVIVVQSDDYDLYETPDDLVGAGSIVFESGSAADLLIHAIEGIDSVELKGATSQSAAFTDVLSGASDVAVVDITMAQTMLAEGTDYSAALIYKDIGFAPEEYGIGMRDDEQGRELLAALNAIIAEYKENGTLDALYDKYIANVAPADDITFWSVTLSLLRGFAVTCLIFIVTLGCALPLGLLISFGTMSRFAWLRGLLKTIIWIIRGIPLMLLVITIYYVPGILMGTVAFPALVAVFIAFVINYACYFSEIFRGGIQSISKGQYEAGQALGMTKSQIFFRIVLLQVIKRIIPPMSNEIITLVKDTALARVILVEEIILRAEDFILKGFIWPLFYSAVFYLVFVGILTLVFRYAEKKLSYFKV